jgi:competence protein ComEA
MGRRSRFGSAAPPPAAWVGGLLHQHPQPETVTRFRNRLIQGQESGKWPQQEREFDESDHQTNRPGSRQGDRPDSHQDNQQQESEEPEADARGRVRWQVTRAAVVAVVGLLLAGGAVLLVQVGTTQFLPVSVQDVPTPGVAVPPRGQVNTGDSADPVQSAQVPEPSGDQTPGPSIDGMADPGTAVSGRTEPKIQVHVVGAVAHPGLLALPAGSRIHDAIAGAGGTTSDAALDAMNLAAVLQDGTQLVVPTQAEVAAGTVAPVVSPPSPAVLPPGGTIPAWPQGKVNLNTATIAELETLPRVGPVLAAKIISWRQEHGRFTAVKELDAVDGVGPKLLEALLPMVTL